MRKTCLITIFSFLSLPFIYAQSLYSTKEGTIIFFSNSPIENISAFSQKVSSMLDIEKGEIAFMVNINTFQFPRALMQQHFNESYMESAKYPKATFKGKIVEKIDTTITTPQKVTIKGDLDIHGVTQHRTIPAELTLKEGTLKGDAKFIVKLADHHIDIPKIVFKKIAEQIEITVTMDYSLLLK